MIKLLCPVKKTVWGLISSLENVQRAIIKSGQPFGVDQSGPACNVVPTAPCDRTYYQYLGFGLHGGIDLPISTGTEIYASTDGKVCELSDKPTNGLGVVIYDPVQKCKTLYWHLLSYNVTIGQEVKAGDLIGLSDNTGYSVGPHLHFELKTTDEHGITIESVDPMPYFVFDDMLQDKLVKANKDVFRLARGEKDLFLNKESFDALDGRWDKIENITQGELDAIPDGFVLIAVKQE